MHPLKMIGKTQLGLLHRRSPVSPAESTTQQAQIFLFRGGKSNPLSGRVYEYVLIAPKRAPSPQAVFFLPRWFSWECVSRAYLGMCTAERVLETYHRTWIGRPHRDGALTAGRSWHPNQWRVAPASKLEPIKRGSNPPPQCGGGGGPAASHRRTTGSGPTGLGHRHGPAIDYTHSSGKLIQHGTAGNRVLAETSHATVFTGEGARRTEKSLTSWGGERVMKGEVREKI